MEEEEDQEFDRAANCNTRFDHEAVAILEHHGRRIGVIGSKSLAVDAEDSTTEEQVVTHVAAPHARLVGVSEEGLAAHGMLTLWPGVIDTESRKKTVSGKENWHHPVLAHPAAGALTLSTGLRTLVGLKSRRRFSGSGLLEVLDWYDDAQQGRDAAADDDDAAAHVKVMISDHRDLKERISSSLSMDEGEEEEEEEEEEEQQQQQEEQQELAAARLHRIGSFESMKAMEAVFSDKVNEVEMHVDVLRKRLERAEFMIADLCKQQHSGTDDHEDGRCAGLVAAASGHNAVQQTHRDLEEKDQLLRADVNYARKKDDEEEKMRVLQESVDGLQELCMNHEKSLYGLRQALKNHHGCFKDDDDVAALGSCKKKKKMKKMNNNNDQELLQLQSWELYRLSDLETAADDLRRELAAARRETTLLRFENKALLDRLRHKTAGAAAAATSKSRSKLITHHLITQLAEDEEEKELAGASKCELMLQEYVVSLEEDLRQSQAHCTLLLQDQEELSLERYELLCSLADAYLRLSELEKELNQRVELMKELETDLDKSTLASKQKSRELALVAKERDELRKEGDSMAQEALHMSLELELLNRRLQQLDEELLLKDGQISILRSNWGDDDDDHYV
ncbi:unnamed protein product [Sphagnum jensenii]|uniref:Uncharacterized protein n=1 Tax=Sphagnum jensenii TaxID=128206 RepID=A0ABP1BEW6_9BRYO